MYSHSFLLYWILLRLLGWPKSSLWLFHNISWENPSEGFGQPNTIVDHDDKREWSIILEWIILCRLSASHEDSLILHLTKRVEDKHRLPEIEHTACYSRRKVLVTQLCPTLWDPMDCSLPGSSVHGILQTRKLEWVAIPFSRGLPQPRDQAQVSPTAGRFFTI